MGRRSKGHPTGPQVPAATGDLAGNHQAQLLVKVAVIQVPLPIHAQQRLTHHAAQVGVTVVARSKFI